MTTLEQVELCARRALDNAREHQPESQAYFALKFLVDELFKMNTELAKADE